MESHTHFLLWYKYIRHPSKLNTLMAFLTGVLASAMSPAKLVPRPRAFVVEGFEFIPEDTWRLSESGS